MVISLSSLDADADLLAVADGLQFGDADFDPGGVEILENDLGDVFGQRFQQRKMAVAQYGLDMLRDLGIVQRIVDVVALAGAAVRQGNVEVELQGLRYALLPLIYSYKSDYFEFAQKDDVHIKV